MYEHPGVRNSVGRFYQTRRCRDALWERKRLLASNSQDAPLEPPFRVQIMNPSLSKLLDTRGILLRVVPFFFVSCAAIYNIRKGDDPELVNNSLTRLYSGTKQTCSDAVEKTFKIQKGTVESRDDSKGILVSGRFDSKGEEYHPHAGRNGAGSHTNYDQQIQFYVQVFENSKQCGIRIYRTRAWARGKELDEIPANYVMEHFWEPFFKEVAEQINGIPAPPALE